MKLTIAVVLPGLLAGCIAATPGSLRVEGERHEMTLRLPPSDAARCAARIAEEHTRIFVSPQGSVREGAAPGSYELQVRNADVLLLVGDFIPAGKGSRATLHRASHVWTTTELPREIQKGC